MAFKRSSYCTASGCVEVDVAEDVVVRDSANPDVELIFTREEWVGFVSGVKAGEFDSSL